MNRLNRHPRVRRCKVPARSWNFAIGLAGTPPELRDAVWNNVPKSISTPAIATMCSPNCSAGVHRLIGCTWALDLQQRRGHNKATVALANKLARIVWATWRFERDFCSNP